MKLSVILPFYYKTEEFDIALGYNNRYLTNDIELVIPIDEPDSKRSVEAILERYNVKNYQIKANPNKHEWRNPTKAINVGLRMAKGDYILVMSPESICITDVYSILTESCIQSNSEVYCGILYKYENYDYKDVDTIIKETSKLEYVWYGSICSNRDSFYKVGGYNEMLTKWGGDDDDIRNRFEHHGYPVIFNTDAKVLHYEKKQTRPVEWKGGAIYNSNLIYSYDYDEKNDQWGYSF